MLTIENAPRKMSDRRHRGRHLAARPGHSRPIDHLRINQSRWYDPTVGKWLSEDPSGFAGGDANLYRYVGNTPTVGTDPSGLQPPPPASEPAVPAPAVPGATKIPQGTAANGYNGLGTWEFSTEEKFYDFLTSMLNPEQNHFPADWKNVVRRGCIGLNMIRIGWGGSPRAPLSPMMFKDAEYYVDGCNRHCALL